MISILSESKRASSLLCAIAALILSLPMWFGESAAQAQDVYPSRRITLIVPFAPGGSFDFVARSVARRMEEVLKQSIVVTNRPGASGRIGVEAVKRSDPDGYTLLLATGITHSILPALTPNLEFDPLKDFVQVAPFAENYVQLFVNSANPAKTVPDFVSYIRSNAGKVNFATGGPGTGGQLLGVIFTGSAGLPKDAALGINYTGEAPGLTALIANQSQFMFATGNPQFVSSGQLRVLATTGRVRSSLYPDAPTMTEAGFPDVYYAGLYGLQAPLGTPPAIVEKLNAAANQALRSEELIKSLKDVGFEVRGGSADDFTKLLVSDADHWKAMVKKYKLVE